jgi:hypothetical protein
MGLVTRPRYAASYSCLVLLLGTLVLPSQIASAAAIHYGDFEAATVFYRNVSEDTNSGDTLPLFGQPDVSGDSLDFDPLGFDANATGAGGIDGTDGQLFFTVDAKTDKNIQSLTISEAGDTTLSGFGTNFTFTSVTANVFVDIVEVNGVAISDVDVNGSLVFTPQNGLYQLGNNGGGPTFNTIWTGTLFIDLDAALAAEGISGRATRIDVNIDNTLTAGSEAGTFALIAKKDFGGLSITINGPNPDPGGGPEIPEPASAALLGLGLCLVVGRRRLL